MLHESNRSEVEISVGAAILDASSDAIIATDRNGAIRFWNPGAERVFGFSASEALGNSLDLIIPEPFRVRHWDGWGRVLETGQTRYGDGDLLAVPGLHREGHRISLEFTIVLLRGEDRQIDGMAAIVRDVTKRFEETRALRQKLAAFTAAKP